MALHTDNRSSECAYGVHGECKDTRCVCTCSHTGRTTEYTYPGTQAGEIEAHIARRAMIKSGFTVSLIALDPSRDVFAFDRYN